MTVNKALKKIIDQNGGKILESPDKVQSMIMDYTSSHDQDVQLFCLSCQKGLLRYGQKILITKDSSEIKDVAIKAKEMLQNNAFMDEYYAIKSVNLLLDGLGIPLVINSDTLEIYRFNQMESKTISKKAQSGTYGIQISDNRMVFDESLIRDLMVRERRGDVSAMILLGHCYFHGIAVTEDWFIAEYYYYKVLVHGDINERKEATNRINEIYNKRQNNF